MSTQILMPALSPTMEEGTLAKWLVKAGDRVEPGQVIAEIETDKATMELEAEQAGVIGKIVVASAQFAQESPEPDDLELMTDIYTEAVA